MLVWLPCSTAGCRRTRGGGLTVRWGSLAWDGLVMDNDMMKWVGSADLGAMAGVWAFFGHSSFL